MNAQPTVADQSVFCAHCDMPNAPDTAYCVGCGVPLRAESQPPAPPLDAPRLTEAQPPAPPLDAPRQQHCGTCGITNPSGALFCVNCGVSLADPRPRPIQGYAPPGMAAAGRTADWTLAQHIYIGTVPARAEVPLLARALWFIFVGLWAGQLWLILAWLLNLTLIGLPLGMWMLSRLPQVMTLRSTPTPRPAPVNLGQNAANFAVRAVYFVLIGWWVSLLWMELAWLIAASAIGLPLSFLMFERVATLTTLAEA